MRGIFLRQLIGLCPHSRRLLFFVALKSATAVDKFSRRGNGICAIDRLRPYVAKTID